MELYFVIIHVLIYQRWAWFWFWNKTDMILDLLWIYDNFEAGFGHEVSDTYQFSCNLWTNVSHYLIWTWDEINSGFENSESAHLCNLSSRISADSRYFSDRTRRFTDVVRPETWTHVLSDHCDLTMCKNIVEKPRCLCLPLEGLF